MPSILKLFLFQNTVMKKTCSLCNFLFIIFILGLPKNIFSQNVGIGTTTPTRAKLEVHGAAGSTNAIFGGESTGMSVQRNWPGIGFNQYHTNSGKYIADGFAAVQYLDPESGYLIFDMFPNGTKDATIATYNRGPVIASDGNIGIRTIPTSASLYVKKAGNFSGSVVFGGSLNNSHFHYGATEDTYIRGGKATSRVFFNDLGGGKILMGSGSAHVSINNGIPAYPLEIREVNETGLRLIQSSTNTNSWEMRVEITPVPNPEFHPDLNLLYNGSYKGGYGWGSGVYYTYSDRRLKTNIQDIPSTLEKYMKLEPVEY
jgi:hypothetical protein